MLWRQLPALLRIAAPYHAGTLAALSVLEAYIVSRSKPVALITWHSVMTRLHVSRPPDLHDQAHSDAHDTHVQPSMECE